MVERRFVFVVGSAQEVLNGALLEIRATLPEIASDLTTHAAMVREGATMTLIGERIGFRSGSRFIPLVTIDRVPEVVVRNEQWSGDIACSCQHAQCVMCDDDGMRDAETARLERLHDLTLNANHAKVA